MMQKHNLIIIFGTSRGLGAALHAHAAKLVNNDFLLINRKVILGSKKANEKYLQ